MFDNNDEQGTPWLIGCLAIAVPFVLLAMLTVIVGALILAFATGSAGEGGTEAAEAETAAVPAVFPTAAPPDAAGYAWTLINDDFDNPVYVTHAGDGSGRLFGVEQTGMVWVIEDGEQLPEPFLDISNQIPAKVLQGGYSEQGLLGLAFAPDFETSGEFYLSYTNINGDSMLERWRVSEDDPNRADPASAEVLLTVDQPFEDHNGGYITFGPDGYLWFGLGDGGNVNEPNTRSQAPDLLLGKILRLDVSGETYTAPADNLYATDAAFLPEIWALGLRNPWRFSFDRANGDLYIADVGQWLVEEVNFVAAGTSAGMNFGWSTYEGSQAYFDNPIENATPPVLEYPHDQGCSVTGGFVYRGTAMPELQGYYFYGDYCLGNLWLGWRDEAGAWQSTLWMRTARQITSFGQDEAGELYLVDYKGEILRLEHAG